MSKRGENIFKRKDGRWEARYIKGRELSGKARYGFCYGKTYREAKEKVMKMKSAVLVQAPAQTAEREGGHSLSFYCEEWMDMQRNEIRKSTYVKYESILRRHICPRLGNCCPADMTSFLIDRFKWELLREEGLSVKTVRDILIVLRSILIYISRQHPGLSSIPEFHYPKAEKKEMRVLTVQEQQKLVRYLVTELDECKLGILLALFTGLRIGEICALKWENISLESKTIHICATIQRLKNIEKDSGKKTILWIGEPKSEASLRTIPLSDTAAEFCRKMKPCKAEYYLLTGTQRPMEPRTLQYRLKKYTDACDLEGVHFHTLRHTFATRCVEVGFELKSLSEVMGHANTSITLDRYAHSSMELKRSNLNKLKVFDI